MYFFKNSEDQKKMFFRRIHLYQAINWSELAALQGPHKMLSTQQRDHRQVSFHLLFLVVCSIAESSCFFPVSICLLL